MLGVTVGDSTDNEVDEEYQNPVTKSPGFWEDDGVTKITYLTKTSGVRIDLFLRYLDRVGSVPVRM